MQLPIAIHLYIDRWVVSSRAKNADGMTVHQPPVRVLSHGAVRDLARVLSEVAQESLEPVPVPVPGDPSALIGIRALAVGEHSWPKFVNRSRAFILVESDGALILEEWPQSERTFSAKASWRKRFRSDDFAAVALYLVDNVPPGRRPTSTRSKSKPKQ